MTRTQARRWALAAAAGLAADYAGIPQNALLAVTTGVVFRFLSHSGDPTGSWVSRARRRSPPPAPGAC